MRQGRSGRVAFRAEGETAAKRARLGSDPESLGLFDDAPVTSGAQRCAHSKDGLALYDVKRLIEEDRCERKALKKDKKRSLREGQKGTSKPESRALGLSGSRGDTTFNEVISSVKERFVKRVTKRHGSLVTDVLRRTASGLRRHGRLATEVPVQTSNGSRHARLATAVPLLSRQFFTKLRQPLATPRNKMARNADRHPGMLGTRMLQRMSDKLSRDGSHTDWEVLDTPPVASAYHLQEVRFIHPNTALRHGRVMSTLAEAID